jgi:hypothetical protein
VYACKVAYAYVYLANIDLNCSNACSLLAYNYAMPFVRCYLGDRHTYMYVPCMVQHYRYVYLFIVTQSLIQCLMEKILTDYVVVVLVSRSDV